MSSSLEKDIFQKLKLFESAVSHAWVCWKEEDIVCLRKSQKDCPIPEGNYSLSKLLDEKSLKKFYDYRKEIVEEVSDFYFTLRYEGVKSHIQCSSVKKDGEINCLWVVIPEKDNSIFYLQNAAHDFRSPLGSIIGVVNLMQHSLRSGELDKEEITTLLEMIKVNTDKALTLASEIMELAEIESESYELKVKPVVLREFVQTYIQTHRLITLKKQIKVNFVADSNAQVLINEPKLTRALDNVLSNSVKFSEVGSNINFSLTDCGNNVVLEIADEGIGMSEELLKHVFVRFGNAKRNGLQGEPSHGLGMSIVRQIIKLHDGDVDIESEEGKGTKVSLTLKKKE